MTLTPRRILITGASSGLGAALALHYAAPGIALCLSGRDPSRLEDIARAARAKQAMVDTAVLDVRDGPAMHNWITAQDRAAPIDLVIANAGVSGGPRDGLESPAQVQEIYDVNVDGVMNTIAPILPCMMARGEGQVAIMSSLAAFAPWPGAPAYAASKAAVKTHGLALRIALEKHGVAVNVICPGFVDTPMTRVNPYHMPWLMDAGRAGRIMARGLACNRAVIAFPWQTALLARTVGALPYAVQRLILSGAPAKPTLDSK